MNNFARSLQKAEEFASDGGIADMEHLRLQKEINELRRQNKRLRHQLIEMEHVADLDPLAPVYNRRAFIRELGRAQSVLDRYDIRSAVAYFDLDAFKSVNDRFGHAIGDDIIREVGSVLSENTRECDMVARLGGDEFGVLLFKVTETLARKKAEALAERLADIRINLPTGEVQVKASWGVAPCETDLTAEQTLSNADKDMFAAKGTPLV